MRLRLTDGSEVDARIKGKRLRPVCGDRVIAEPITREKDWLIVDVCPRDNALTRPDLRGRTEVLAANVDILAVVAAASPSPDWSVVDRYLSAAETMPATALVIFNKTDLPVDATSVYAVLDDYRRIGYQTLRCSAKHGDGIARLGSALTGETAIIVGQSGVGKSTIIGRLTGRELRTASLSDKSGTGRHTTVNSEMLPLPDGGSVIDSPGVRDYAPALHSQQYVAAGFREIAAVAPGCRFNDCRHREEPGCAVKQAVLDGEISERRYTSYCKLLELTERLTEAKY